MTATKRNAGKRARAAAALGAKAKPEGHSRVVRMHSVASGRDIAVSRVSDRIIRETSKEWRQALEILADS